MHVKRSRGYHTLVIGNQEETIYRLQRILADEKDYYLQFTSTGQEALEVTAQSVPDIIVIDDGVDEAESLGLVRELAMLAPTTPIIALAAQTAVTYVREALLAGARAFITKPMDSAEVINTLNRLVQMEFMRHDRHQHGKSGDAKRHAQVITIVSPKGGVGCTTLAINLAVAIRERCQGRVVLVDGQGRLGDLETALNLQVQYALGDVLNHSTALDADLIRGVLVEHASGVRVLTSSHRLDGNRVTGEIFEKVIHYLSSDADYILIDAGSVFEEQTSVALSMADTVVLVATPEVTTLRRIVFFLQAADQEGFPRERLLLAVNRDGVRGGVSAQDVSHRLNMEVATTIPEDGGLVTYSLNRGVPLITSDPRSAVARSVHKLAQLLVAEEQTQPDSAASKGLVGRLTTMWRSTPA